MKLGIIGYGNIAKKHLAAVAELPDIQVTAIYDKVDIDSLSGIKTFEDLNAFLKEDLDIISICTPNGFHLDHSLAALSRAAVICEKPLALTHVDCQKIINSARETSKNVFCTMQNRYSPVSQWLKKITQEKSLGELYLVNVSCYWNRNKNYYAGSDWRGKSALDGGTLFTQFSHYVDTLYWLFGDMKILNANFSNFDHDEMIEFEDTGIFNFTLDSGGMGTFSYTTSCYEKNFESSLTLIGSQGTVKVAGQYMDRVEYCNINGVEPPTLTANDNLANIREVYLNAIAHINGIKSNACSAEDGMAVVKIIEEVYSYR